MIKKSSSRKAFEVFNVIFMLFLSFIAIYPLIFVLNASFSDSNALLRNGGKPLWLPIDANIQAYKMVFSNKLILTGYMNTIFVVVAGTVVDIVLTSMCAYPLSKKGPMLNSIITKIIVFTMFFSGGLIPTYMLVKNVGLMDNIWALIIPASISTYNMIILRTGFSAIPESLTESALIDGASQMKILFKIMLPLVKPTLTVVALYYAVTRWNAWFDASIYLQRSSEKWPLQLILRQILIQNDVNTGETGVDQVQNVAESIKYATIIVATLPVVCIYPFVQKYFTKGIAMGAVKG